MFLLFGVWLALQDASPVTIVEKWVGSDSKLDNTQYLRLTDAASWKQFWKEHSGSEEAPAVDFEKYMVLTCLRKTPGTMSLELAEIRESKDAIRMIVQFHGEKTEGKAASHSTYAIAVVARSEKKVEFLLRRNAGMDEAPKDKLIKTLEALKP